MAMAQGAGGGHAIAGTIGGALLWAVAASLVGQVYLLGLSLVYLRVTEGLDLTASEAALRATFDEARRRTAELGEKARQATRRDGAGGGGGRSGRRRCARPRSPRSRPHDPHPRTPAAGVQPAARLQPAADVRRRCGRAARRRSDHEASRSAPRDAGRARPRRSRHRAAVRRARAAPARRTAVVRRAARLGAADGDRAGRRCAAAAGSAVARRHDLPAMPVAGRRPKTCSAASAAIG